MNASSRSVLTAGTGAPRPTAGGHLNLALFAFAVVGWELVLLLLEPFLPVFAPAGSLGAAVAHWALTGTGWLVGAAVVLRAARRRHGFVPDPHPRRTGSGAVSRSSGSS